MIKDLIPAYAEGLCSEESTKAVEEHIKGCESCKMLAQNISSAPLQPKDENIGSKKAFSKLNGYVKKNRRRAVAMGIVTALVVVVAGTLLFCQIVKPEGSISFETITQSIECRAMMSKLVKGDIEGYMDDMSYVAAYQNLNTYTAYKEIKIKNTELLTEVFAEVAPMEPYIENCHSTYLDMYMEPYDEKTAHPTVYTDCIIAFRNCDKRISVGMLKMYDGRYSVESTVVLNDDETPADGTLVEKFSNMITFSSTKGTGILSGVLEEKLLMAANKEEKTEFSQLLVDRFEMQYRDKIAEGGRAFIAAGYKFEDATMSLVRYDSEKGMIYNELYLTAVDGSKKAVMRKRIYNNYGSGFILSQEPAVIVSDDEKLTQALRDMFD